MTQNDVKKISVRTAKFTSEKGHRYVDAVLVTSDNHKFPVSKIVLAVRSDFFKCLFLSKQTRDKTTEFTLRNISHQELEPILNWLYHGELQLDKVETVLKVLESAEFLGVLEVSGLCQEWLLNNVNSQNVLGVLRYAEEHYHYSGRWDGATW